MALDLSKTGKKLIRKLAAKSDDKVFYLCYDDGATEDPVTGAPVWGEPVRYPVDASKADYKAEQIDGTNILLGDWVLTMPYDTVIPDQPWWCEFNGKKYTKESDMTVNPHGILQVYKFQMRSA